MGGGGVEGCLGALSGASAPLFLLAVSRIAAVALGPSRRLGVHWGKGSACVCGLGWRSQHRGDLVRRVGQRRGAVDEDERVARSRWREWGGRLGAFWGTELVGGARWGWDGGGINPAAGDDALEGLGFPFSSPTLYNSEASRDGKKGYSASAFVNFFSRERSYVWR